MIPTSFSLAPLAIGSLVTSAWDFANSMLPVLGPIAGIGIGFTLAIGIVAWLGSMLAKIFTGKGR